MGPLPTFSQTTREALAAAVPPERVLTGCCPAVFQESRNPIRPGLRPDAVLIFRVLYFLPDRFLNLRRFIVNLRRLLGLQLGRDFLSDECGHRPAATPA